MDAKHPLLPRLDSIAVLELEHHRGSICARLISSPGRYKLPGSLGGSHSAWHRILGGGRTDGAEQGAGRTSMVKGFRRLVPHLRQVGI